MISFAWTSAALLAGRKTVTRRDWDQRYAESFYVGEHIAAYDRQPRYRGKQIATIELLQRPYLEPLAAMPDYDYDGEGWSYYAEHPEARPKTILGQRVDDTTFTRAGFDRWQRSGGSLWVVRFRLVAVVEGATNGR